MVTKPCTLGPYFYRKYNSSYRYAAASYNKEPMVCGQTLRSWSTVSQSVLLSCCTTHFVEILSFGPLIEVQEARRLFAIRSLVLDILASTMRTICGALTPLLSLSLSPSGFSWNPRRLRLNAQTTAAIQEPSCWILESDQLPNDFGPAFVGDEFFSSFSLNSELQSLLTTNKVTKSSSPFGMSRPFPNFVGRGLLLIGASCSKMTSPPYFAAIQRFAKN